jgi:hypothetical protein
MSELLDVVLQQLMNWTAAAPGNNAAGGHAAAATVPATAAAAAATAAHHQQQQQQQDVSMLTATHRAAGAAAGQDALQDAGSAATHMQGSLQHTQASLDRVGVNLAAIQGVLSTPNNTHSTLAAQYQALLQERTALQQLYGQLVAEGEAAGTRLELLLSATRARQQQQQQGGASGVDALGDGGSAEQQQQQQQRREAARRLLLGGGSSSSTSSSPTAAGRGGISQLLIPNSSSSSRPVSVAPPTGRLPAAQRPPTPDRSVCYVYMAYCFCVVLHR